MSIPYRPLRKEDQEIRILVLERAAERSSPLRCKLEHALLSNASYSAISYVWGQQEETRAEVEIEYSTKDPANNCTKIENLKTSIGENLGQAFYHLRKSDEDLRLSADAICINQQDDVEKSWQVGLMGDIFKTAALTYIWLGPTSGEHDERVALGLDSLKDIGSRAMSTQSWSIYGWKRISCWLAGGATWSTAEEDPRQEEGKEIIGLTKMIYEDLARTNSLFRFYTNLHCFSKLSWWTRVWVIQEYALSKSVLFIYGEQHVRGDALLFSTMLTYRLRYHFVKQSPFENSLRDTAANIPYVSTGLIVVLLLGIARSVPNLKELMVFLYLSANEKFHRSTNPRDKVFALLGLADSTMSVEADYRKSVEQVYTDISATFLSSGDASLLSIPRPVRSTLKLRTWATDWTALSAPYQEFSGSLEWFNASNSSRSRSEIYRLSGDFVDVLGLEGTNLCSVSELGNTFTEVLKLSLCHSDDNPGNSLISEIKDQVYPLMRDLLGPSVEDAGSDHQKRLHTLVRNFTNQFCSVKMWINEVFLASKKQNIPFQAQCKTILDIIFHSGKQGKYHSDHTDLYSKIQSIEDLHKPSTWLSSLEDNEGTAPMVAVRAYARGSRVFTSGCGRLGYAPESSQKGDLVVIFYGVPTPLAIREMKPNYYEIIGPAYVHGVMQGEFISEANPPSKEFLLI